MKYLVGKRSTVEEVVDTLTLLVGVIVQDALLSLGTWLRNYIYIYIYHFAF